MQKAKLVSDAPDELADDGQRLNKTGMNVKKQQQAESAAKPSGGPPTRILGRKY